MLDPCERNGHPGWILRNALALARCHWKQGTEVPVVCYREGRQQGAGAEDSLVLRVTITPAEEGEACPKTATNVVALLTSFICSTSGM